MALVMLAKRPKYGIFFLINMGEAAFKLAPEKVSDDNQENPPVSETRSLSKESVALAHGPEAARDLMGNWTTIARRDITDATRFAIEQARKDGAEDLTSKLSEEERAALAKVQQLEDKTQEQLGRFMDQKDVPREEVKPNEQQIRVEVKPSIPTTPETDEEAAKLKLELEENEAELKELQGIPQQERNKKQELQINLLTHEIEVQKINQKRFEAAEDIKFYQQELSLIKRDLLDLLRKKSTANDTHLEGLSEEDKIDARIELLPFEMDIMGRAQVMRMREKELGQAMYGRYARLKEYGLQLVVLDRLLNKDRALLGAHETEEARAAEAKRKQAEEQQRRRKELQQKQAEEQRKKERVAKIKGGFGGTLGAAAAGVGAGLWGISSVFKWMDKGLEWLFKRDLADKLQWWWRKLTFADDKKKK